MPNEEARLHDKVNKTSDRALSNDARIKCLIGVVDKGEKSLLEKINTLDKDTSERIGKIEKFLTWVCIAALTVVISAIIFVFGYTKIAG